MTPNEILDEVKGGFGRRKFVAGLLIAFIDFLRELDATGGRFGSLEEFYEAYPRLTERKGRRLNTLMVHNRGSGRDISIRPYYDQIQNWFRGEKQRFDYPSAAPHATQAWGEYLHWLEALLSFDASNLDWLKQQVEDFVLAELPSHEIDPDSIQVSPPVFLRFLEDFDLSKHRGEITGAAYQGTVFGYLRAESPHLQVEVGKVRTGSKREKRVGDIDARDADVLVLSAEVKQYVFGQDNLADVAEFANLIAKHKALGLVVALDFQEGATDELAGMGLRPVARQDLIDRVRLWDPLKQQIAVNSLIYYVGFRENNSALHARIKEFLEGVEAP